MSSFLFAIVLMHLKLRPSPWGLPDDIMSEITRMQNWLCPGGMPPSVQQYAQRAACEGIHGIQQVARLRLHNKDTYDFCTCTMSGADVPDISQTMALL